MSDFRITVDPLMPPDKVIIGPDFHQMTQGEIDEFWADPCWRKHYAIIEVEPDAR